MSKCETGFVGGHPGESGLVFNFDARTCFIDIVRPTSKTPWQELKKFGILPALIWTYSTSIFSKSSRNTSKWQSNKPHGFLDLHHGALIQLSFSGVWRTEGRMLLWLMQSCQWHLTEIRRNFVIPGKLPEFLFSVKSSYLKLFFGFGRFLTKFRKYRWDSRRNPREKDVGSSRTVPKTELCRPHLNRLVMDYRVPRLKGDGFGVMFCFF